MKRFLKLNFPLILVILCALFVRLVFLNIAPIALNHDEVTFVENAKAVFLTGKDLSGTWSPLSLTPISYGFPMSELPFLLVSPWGIFPSTLFWARLPYALFSAGLVVILYFIAQKLFGRKQALAVGLVAAFNPWGIFLGRTAFDSPLAVFFYMLSLLLILHLNKKKILFVFIPLFIAFFSYIGTKIILVPFTIVISTYSYILNKRKDTLYYSLLVIATIILTGIFMISLFSHNTGQRLSELSTPFSSSVAKTVDQQRSLTLNSPLTPIFSNKFEAFTSEFLHKYTGIFSTQYQFFYGDSDQHLSLWFHGYFYYLDFIFLILGYCALFTKNKKAWVLLTALILIAPIPAALYQKDSIYVTRGVLIYPLFILLIGFGIYTFVDYFKKYTKTAIVIILTLIYLLLFLNFTNIYLFRYPMYNSEGVDFSSRLMANYVLLASKSTEITVYTNEPDALFKDFLFYDDFYNRGNTKIIAKKFKAHDFSLKNVTFKTGCPKDAEVKTGEPIVVAVSSGCNSGIIYNTDYKVIPQLGDATPVYKIYFDNICKNFGLKQFVSGLNLQDFDLKNLTNKQFCEDFILNRR